EGVAMKMASPCSPWEVVSLGPEAACIWAVVEPTVMPLSVLNGSGAPPGAPRNQPANPGLPAPEVEPTSLTSTWKLPHCSRRVAPHAWPTGSGVFFSAGPRAWISSLMVVAELRPKGSAGPRPSAPSTMASLVRVTVVVVDSSVVVVGAAVVVVAASFLSLEQAAALSSTTEQTIRATRDGRISLMAAQSSQSQPGRGGQPR